MGSEWYGCMVSVNVIKKCDKIHFTDICEENQECSEKYCDNIDPCRFNYFDKYGRCSFKTFNSYQHEEKSYLNLN